MHPEIRQQGRGSCPICGMPLEPEEVSLEETENPELIDFTRIFKLSVILAVPLLLLSMSDLIPGKSVQHLFSNWANAGIQFILATPVVLWAGRPFFERGWSSLRSRNLNMFTLIALGTDVAYVFSLFGTFLPEVFPKSVRGHDGMVPLYYEASAAVITLVLFGQMLELRARSQTGNAIRALLGLAAKTAKRIKTDGSEEDVSVDHILIGDLLRVRPREKVSVDGEVVEGRTAIDESMISGEPIPVEKSVGEKLTGATVNGTGSVVMRATRVGADTLLSTNRKNGFSSSKNSCANSKTCRNGCVLFRADCHLCCFHHCLCLVLFRSRTETHSCNYKCRFGFNYRMPVRPWIG